MSLLAAARRRNPVRNRRTFLRGVGALAAALIVVGLPAKAQTVPTYHGGADRSGNFTMPQFTWERARALRLDPGFVVSFEGHLYAQPLYWKPQGGPAGRLIVASESNIVTAIDAVSGKTVWQRSLGIPAPLSAFRCGNIDPLGVTGTPVIDSASGTLYLDAMVAEAAGPRHQLFALALSDGAVEPGWPVDVGEALGRAGMRFDSRVQNQRGALLLLDGALYVPYGGFFGDCGDYHGWVVGVRTGAPHQVFAWQTRGRAGGIWAPGGIASDGHSIFAVTGNTIGAREWGDGDGVFRLAPDLRHSESPSDFFAAADWQALDRRDADLGGTNGLPFDLPAAGGAARPLLLALGKDAKAYLLDRNNLGGIGGALVETRVADVPIRTAPAAYPVGREEFVAFQGRGAACPRGQEGDLTVLRIAGGAPPAIATAWCGGMEGAGSPIVTTTDGRDNPIVWILGAEGDGRLHGYRGDNGAPLFTGPPLAGLRHFQTLIAADARLFVGADRRLFAFSLPPANR